MRGRIRMCIYGMHIWGAFVCVRMGCVCMRMLRVRMFCVRAYLVTTNFVTWRTLLGAKQQKLHGNKNKNKQASQQHTVILTNPFA